MVVFEQKRLYSGKVVVLGKSGGYRSKVVGLGQNSCNREIVVIFRQKWF